MSRRTKAHRPSCLQPLLSSRNVDISDLSQYRGILMIGKYAHGIWWTPGAAPFTGELQKEDLDEDLRTDQSV